MTAIIQCRYWRLPALMFAYIVASYLASSLSRRLSYLKEPLEWLHWAIVDYRFSWFTLYGWYGTPLWLLCHLALLIACLRYARSGSKRWGTGVVLIGLLCSAGGAYLLTMLELMLFRPAL